MFPFLTVFLIFLVITYARREQLRRRQREREAAFWAREEEANRAPAKDLSTIDYIRVPLSEFPLGEVDDDDLLLMEEELADLAKRPLLNITNMTNTDVKLEYGAANFDAIVKMGEDYDRLIALLLDYAKGLVEGGHMEEALPALEYGARIGSDMSGNYTLLGECYRALGREEDLARLRETVAASELALKDSILREL